MRGSDSVEGLTYHLKTYDPKDFKSIVVKSGSFENVSTMSFSDQILCLNYDKIYTFEVTRAMTTIDSENSQNKTKNEIGSFDVGALLCNNILVGNGDFIHFGFSLESENINRENKCLILKTSRPEMDLENTQYSYRY